MTNFDEEKSPEKQNIPDESTDDQTIIEIETIKFDSDEPVDVRITVEDKEETPKTRSDSKDEDEQEIAFARKSYIKKETQYEAEKANDSDDIPEEAYDKKDKNYKKYVVRMHKENTAFLDNLSHEERNKLFNKCIKDVITNQVSEKKKRLAQEAIRHIIVIIITVIIGIPLTFHVVNFSIKSTLKSYKYMQINFEKLYQQKQLDKF